MGGGDASGNVGLRINCMGAGINMKGALFSAPGHWSIDPHDVANRHFAKRVGKPHRPHRIATVARAVFGDDRAGDKFRPRSQPRRQTARDAKTDDRRRLFRDHHSQGALKTQGIAGARDGANSRTGDESSFRLEARDGDDPGAGYIPTRTGERLPSFRLR